MMRILTGLTSLLIGVGSISAADWPEFRGPTAQGHYQGPDLPKAWDSKTNIIWKTPIPGLGWSSPAIVDGWVYLTTAVPVGADHELRVICLDAAKGTVKWNTKVSTQDGKSAPKVHAKNSHASPSPIVSKGRVYVHFGHQGTACVDATSGRIIWSKREIKYSPVHGNGGSPALVGDKLIFSCDGASNPMVVALDAATGDVKWKTPRSWDSDKRFAFCTPVALEHQGRTIVFLPGAGGAAAYDPDNGNELWAVHYKGYSVVPRPVFGHGLIFISTGYDSPSLLAVRLEESKDRVAWKLTRGAPHNPSPLLVGNELYLVSDGGIASCVDAKSGKVHWSERVPGNYSASPFFANGFVYFLNEQGLTTVIRATTEKLDPVAKNAMNERTLASCAAVDGTIFLRTEKHLYRIGTK